jgi:thiamine phosphate synthase YjbQ (UPF0047 family)
MKKRGKNEGFGCLNTAPILVNAMHITASVFINDDESGLHRDYDRWLEKLAPMNRSANISITGPVRTMATPT